MPRTPAARQSDANDPEQTIGHHAASIRAPHLEKNGNLDRPRTNDGSRSAAPSGLCANHGVSRCA